MCNPTTTKRAAWTRPYNQLGDASEPAQISHLHYHEWTKIHPQHWDVRYADRWHLIFMTKLKLQLLSLKNWVAITWGTREPLGCRQREDNTEPKANFGTEDRRRNLEKSSSNHVEEKLAGMRGWRTLPESHRKPLSRDPLHSHDLVNDRRTISACISRPRIVSE